MKIINPGLEAMAVRADQYPSDDLLEIALAGRSNVGKSSLINKFVGRKKLAYTSSIPGKTRTVNFYNVDGLFRLVDLPGYGYAKASAKDQEAWAASIDEYLTTRPCLKEVILVCDLRHEPTALDRQMMDWIRAMDFSGYVVATKADKLPRTKLEAHKKQVMKGLKISDSSRLILFSADTGYGLEEAHDLVARILDREGIKRTEI